MVQQRSSFVDVVAWIFILLSAFGTLIGILQNLMLHTLFRDPAFAQALQAPPPPGMPAAFGFFTSNFLLLFAAVLLVSAFTLVSSIGLLRRKNWARLCFVGVMVFSIIWNIAGLAFQLSVFSSMFRQTAALASQGVPDMQPFFVGVAVMSALFAICFSVLFGWIAKRLLSPEIVAEFRTERA